VILYGRETWFLTSRDEHRLKLFENRLLRIILVSKKDELAGRWRELHKELHIPYSPCIIRMIESWKMSWAGQLARTGEECM
jgi:hypothetical protein